MRKLPEFVLVSHPDLPQTFVMQTVPPYVIAAPYCIPKKDEARVSDMVGDIVNGRVVAAKVPGFTIFLTLWGTLPGVRVDALSATAVMTKMADFYRETALAKNKHKNRIYEEGVPDDIDERRGRFFKELKKK